MKKSIFLFFAAILCAMSVSAKMVYLKPGNWLNDGADVWVHSWNGTQGDVAGVLKPVGLGLYGLDIKDNTKCLFVRQSGGQSGINWNSNWYQTGDLTITSEKECYHVSGWDVKGWIAVPSAYIAGATELTGSSWSANAAANKMTKQSDGTWTLTKNIEIAKGDYEYKVTDGSWDWSYGEGSNNKKINIPATGKYEVTFTYTPSPEKVSAIATPIYSVTVNAGEGGNATGSGECKNGEYVTIDATPETNYEFVNWTFVNGTGSFESNTTASTKFYATSDATIQANFRSTLIYSLTTSFGEGIASVTGATNPVTLGESYAISATPKTGYAFKTWTAEPAANATFADAESATTDVTVLNGSVTVTASATEIMSTLTTANTYDKGTPTIDKPTASAAEIGIATTATVTAATNEDYVVASWTLKNCDRTDAGGTNANPITVKANGDGAAATVTANYEMIKYYIAGSLPAITWTPGDHALTENSGVHSMTFTNLPVGSYEFKITKGASWATQWGYDDLDYPYVGVSGSGDDGQNVKITLSEAKTITIKFNSSTKKISFDGLTPLIKQNLKYTVTVPKGTTKCYLVGLGDWNNFREMTQDPGNNRIFTLTVNDVYITDEYKYSASKNWDNAEADVNNYDAGNRTWSESDVVAKWKNIDLLPEALTYTVTVPAGTEECYIAGTMNNWEFAAMEKSPTTPNTFTIDIANANEAHEYKYACKKNWDYAEVNDDGSSVSNRTYSANDVVAKWGYPTYTVAGDNRIVFGEEWKETLTDNDMVDQGDGTYKWTKSKIALKKNTEIKFQVVKNHSWENKWPNDPWVINTISKDGYYTITIIFKESDQSITATATWTGEAPFKDFSNQPATLYFHPSFHWTSDHAQFAAYFYNEGFGADAEPTWANMTDSDGDGVYEVTNAKQHEYVIICRMNPDRTENKWDNAVSWNKIETGITIPNTAGNLNTCIAFWKNSQGDVPTSECTWVAPTPLTDKNWSDFVTTYAGKKINAVVERSFKSGQYHTLCLPFDIPTNWLGEGTQAYQLTSIVANNTGDKLSLKATKWNTIVAGQPYIIVPVKGSEYEHIIINGVVVKNASASTNVASGEGYKATLKAVTATDGTQTNGSTEYYVGANDGHLYNAQTNKLGLRAIIELTTTGGKPLPAKVRAYVAAGENVETGVEDLFTTETPIKLIENGQLIIIRDGVKYNVQGQVIR